MSGAMGINWIRVRVDGIRSCTRSAFQCCGQVSTAAVVDLPSGSHYDGSLIWYLSTGGRSAEERRGRRQDLARVRTGITWYCMATVSLCTSKCHTLDFRLLDLQHPDESADVQRRSRKVTTLPFRRVQGERPLQTPRLLASDQSRDTLYRIPIRVPYAGPQRRTRVQIRNTTPPPNPPHCGPSAPR